MRVTDIILLEADINLVGALLPGIWTPLGAF